MRNMILCLCLGIVLSSCAMVLPFNYSKPEIKEFSLSPITLYLITNVSQFPVKPTSPETLGMWLLRNGVSEEIWVCVERRGDRWIPVDGILEHEMLHALNYRDPMSIMNPDRQIQDLLILHEYTFADLEQGGR